MATAKCARVLSLCVFLAGCGTYVPNIQEFPADTVEGQRLVAAIVKNIKCELRDALADLHKVQRRTFLDDWGVQVVLNLQMVEKTAANPNVKWMPPSPVSAVFTLAAGGTASAEATRINKLGSFYTVRELTDLGPCFRDTRGGPFLLQSDLKLNEWLVATVTVGNTGGSDLRRNTPDGPFKQEVLSHEVKFDVVSSLDATPGWTLTRAVVNPSGTFFSASRDRSHTVTITFGPFEVAKGANGKGKPVPSRMAADAALASDIAVSIGNSVRRALPR